MFWALTCVSDPKLPARYRTRPATGELLPPTASAARGGAGPARRCLRVADLSGYKILLAGNHDRCWAGHGQRADGWTERYLDAGFSEVVHGWAEVALDDRTVLACHFPYRGDSHDHDRFVRHRPVHKGAWLLHGHVHERWAQHGRMINVGVDATGFRPINAMTVLELIDAGPMNSLTPASS